MLEHEHRALVSLVRLAITDELAQQLGGILDSWAERPHGVPFAIRLEPGSTARLGINAPVDIESMALLITQRLQSAALNGRLPEPVQGLIEPPDDDPFPTPDLCLHCGLMIEPDESPIGKGWRHKSSGFVSCDQADPHSTVAEL